MIRSVLLKIRRLPWKRTLIVVSIFVMVIGAVWLGLSNGNDAASAQSDDEIADRVQRLTDSLADEVSKWGPPTSTLKSSSTSPSRD